MNSIVVFCGSSEGDSPLYKEAAFHTGKTLAEKNIRVVYGGSKIGLMGIVADAALQHGGEVIGVIPRFLRTKEVAHEGLTELILVDTMHERKLKMHELSDGIITLPGGFGTMEEMFEMLTWAQLGLHAKPVGLLNINNYYLPLQQLCDNMVQHGFLKAEIRDMLLASNDLNMLLEIMNRYAPPAVQKWITKPNT